MEGVEIKTLADIAAMDSATFARFLPDFVAWHRITRVAVEAGATSASMLWLDDGEAGLVRGVRLTDSNTGQATYHELWPAAKQP